MKRKLLSLLLAGAILMTGSFGPVAMSAKADWWSDFGLPTIEFPKLEWPHFNIPTFTIPGTNITIDPTKGLDGLKEITNVIPDKIDVPGTQFSIYPKESLGGNIVKNILPFVGGIADYLNPYKPAASLARAIITVAKPFFDQWVKPLIPKAIKNGAFTIVEQLKNLLKLTDNPIVQNVFLPVWDFLVGPIDDLVVDIIKLLAEEDVAPGGGGGAEGGGGGGKIGGPPTMVIPDPFKNQIPTGYFDQIDVNGIATGWAVDPNNSSASIKVRMHPILGQYPNETVANLPYPRLSYPGNHGFSYRIPSGMRDGKDNILEAYGKDNDEWGVEGKIPGSPKKYKLFEAAFGEIESLDKKTGVISGWAVDPDNMTSPAAVKLTIDGITLPGDTIANLSASYLSAEKLSRAPGASKNIGFKFAIDPTKYHDGKEHVINAYVVNQKDDDRIGPGAKNDLLLANSPLTFRYPAVIPIRFAMDPVVVQQGSRVFQSIEGIANQEHGAFVTMDNEKLDINAERHGYPIFEYWTGLTVKADGTSAKTRSVSFDFKTAPTLSLGLHTITVESPAYDYMAFSYKGSFKINVVPYSSFVAVVPDILTPETEFDLLLKNIPQKIKLTGAEANATVSGIYLQGDRQQSWVQILSVNEKGDGTAVVHAKIPLEASQTRKGSGVIQMPVRIDLKNALAKEELRLSPESSNTYINAKTGAGKDPLFNPVCRSALKPTLEIVGASGQADGKGSGFGCYSKLTVGISGTKAGKPFSITLPEALTWTDAENKGSPMVYSPNETEWNGDLVSFHLQTLGTWSRDYLGVEEITVTIKDAEGNSASAKINMTSPQQVRVMPLGGKPGDEIQPGDDLRVAWKGFGGNILNLSIDGEPFRKLYLEGMGSLKPLPSDPSMSYYDGLYLPRWVIPGEHRLLLEDAGYKAETLFKVAGEVVKEEPKNVESPKVIEKQAEAKVEKPKPTPQITVSPNPAKVGTRITLRLIGFGPLGTVAIYLKGNGKNVKLSGYADYTDSSGALTKEVTLPADLVGGSYIISATDTANATDTTTLTVEAVEPPTPPPAPKPKPVPKVESNPVPPVDTTPANTPSGESVPLPKEGSNQTPTCPAGSTYSPTFHSCIEDRPSRSPYDGLPCPAEGTVPSYATQGCIP